MKRIKMDKVDKKNNELNYKERVLTLVILINLLFVLLLRITGPLIWSGINHNIKATISESVFGFIIVVIYLKNASEWKNRIFNPIIINSLFVIIGIGFVLMGFYNLAPILTTIGMCVIGIPLAVLWILFLKNLKIKKVKND